jgi:hypothetical protein
MKPCSQIVLVMLLTFLVPPIARPQESISELWKRMDYTQQMLFIGGFHAGIRIFEGQKDSQFANQLATTGLFGELQTGDWYPMIHKINGFYSQRRNAYIPLDIPVFLAIAFIKGIPQSTIQSIFSKGGGPEVVKDFYESKSAVLISPEK